MKKFKMLRPHIVTQAVILIACLACSAAAQVGTIVMCKDTPLPPGYKIIRETESKSCPGKKGWLIEKDTQKPRGVMVLMPTSPEAQATPVQKIPVRTDNGLCQVNGGLHLNSIESKIFNIHLTLCLGKLSNGDCVTMTLDENQITADTYTPYAFGLPDPDRGEVELINDTSNPPKQFGELHKLVDRSTVPPYFKQPMRQIKLPTELIDVVVLSQWEYDLRFYRAEDVGPKENGLYVVTSHPHAVWKFKNPAPPSLNRLQMIRTADGVDDVKEFSYDEPEDKWVLLSNGSWVTMKSSIVDPDEPCQRIETRLHREGGEVSKTIKIFRAFPWGQEIVKAIEDPDGQALVTTFSYFEDKKGPHYGFLKSITHPDGTVELQNEQPDPTIKPPVP